MNPRQDYKSKLLVVNYYSKVQNNEMYYIYYNTNNIYLMQHSK